MTIPHDPYAPPSASLERGFASASEAVPATVVSLLAQTRPWVRLVAVAIFALSGLVALAMPVAMFSSLGGTNPGVAAATALVMVLVLLGVYLPPGILLWRYGSRIRDLVDRGGQAELESALRSQKTFWKYVGILLVVLVGIYAVTFVLGFLLVPLLSR